MCHVYSPLRALYQYNEEISGGKFSTRNRYNKWVKRLPEVVKALNNEATRLIDKKTIDAIKEKSVERKLKYKRPVGYEEKIKLYSGDKVRF